MSIKSVTFAAALSLIAAHGLVFAESPAGAVEAVAAAGLLPAAAATVEAPQTLENVEVEAQPMPEMTPAQRRAANRKAREELRRRFGPAIYVLN